MRADFRCLFALLAFAGVLAAQPAFNPGPVLSVPERPNGIAVADLDLDGIADLVATSDLPNKITLHRGLGAGTFAPPATILLGPGVSAHAIRAVDLDINGLPDLVVALDSPGGVQTFVNQGSFVFTPGVFRATGSGARDLAVGDLNGSGYPDIAVSNRDADTASILLNVAGVLGSAVNISTGEDPRAVAIGDIDGDGFQDLAVSAHDDRLVNTYLNNGSGTFAPSLLLSVGPNMRPAGLAIVDLDLNGLGEVVVAASGGGVNAVSVFRTTSPGVMARTDYPTGGLDPDRLVAADLDSDGLVDIAVAHKDSNNLAVLGNIGGAAFGAPVLLAGGTQGQNLAAGDLDGNGSPDLAAAFRDSNDVRLYWNVQGGAVPNPTLSLLNPVAIGTLSTLLISSPTDPFGGYFCGFSLGNFPGFFLSDGRRVPLNIDPLFLFSLDPANPILLNTLGLLDGLGKSFIGINLPSEPALVGATVFAAFAVADPLAPTGIGTLSDSLPITIQ